MAAGLNTLPGFPDVLPPGTPQMSHEQKLLVSELSVHQGLKRYFHNEAISFADVVLVAKLITCLAILRLILSGAFHPRIQKLPNVFKCVFGRWAVKEKQRKFSENLWYACWHTASSFWTIAILYRELWTPSGPGWAHYFFTRGQSSWYWLATAAETASFGIIGWPHLTPGSHVRIFYLAQIAFWSSNMIFLFFETMRSDFYVMFLHHIATCALLGGSYIMNFWRVGLVVLLLHDVADIFLYSAKTMQYSVLRRSIVDGLFTSFALVFFFSRLIGFPWLCVWPSVSCSVFRSTSGGMLVCPWDIPGGSAMVLFLLVLQSLHVFWFWLILKMAVTLKRKKTVTEEGDIRSDDEEEELTPGQVPTGPRKRKR